LLIAFLLTVVALMAYAAPAEAHCYSVWKYPYPQRCGIYARADNARVWYVEITKFPADWERDEAVAKLKAMLNGH
jgi:hypothetical protein